MTNEPKIVAKVYEIGGELWLVEKFTLAQLNGKAPITWFTGSPVVAGNGEYPYRNLPGGRAFREKNQRDVLAQIVEFQKTYQKKQP